MALDAYEPPKRTDVVEYSEVNKPPALIHEWPVGLAVEVGLNTLAVGTSIIEDADLCKQFEITQEQLEAIKNHPAFKAEVRESIAAIKDPYATIRRKAKLGFEYYMDTIIPKLVADDRVSGETKLNAVKFLGKVAGLDAAEKAQEQAAQAEANKGLPNNMPSINIVLTQAPSLQQPSVTVEQTLERVE